MTDFVRLDYRNTINETFPDLIVDDFDLLSIDEPMTNEPRINEPNNQNPSFKLPKYHSIHPNSIHPNSIQTRPNQTNPNQTNSNRTNPNQSKKFSLKSPKKPNIVKSYVSENGTLEISDKKRFLRLGKISLYDGVNGQYLNDKEFMGILDTLNGRVVCVDLDTIYTECVQKNNNTLSIGNMLFNITPETKKVVCDYIFNK